MSMRNRFYLYLQSLPVRECGLKFALIQHINTTGASLPVRECGLKYIIMDIVYIFIKSLPVRECGLKSLILCGAVGK